MNSMNLKRYIDAAVKREVRRCFFKDMDFSSLIKLAENDLKMARESYSAQADRIGSNLSAAYDIGDSMASHVINPILKLTSDLDLALKFGKLLRAKLILENIEPIYQRIGSLPKPDSLTRRNFNNAIKIFQRIYDFVSSARPTKI